jgi:hypothetical protein
MELTIISESLRLFFKKIFEIEISLMYKISEYTNN